MVVGAGGIHDGIYGIYVSASVGGRRRFFFFFWLVCKHRPCKFAKIVGKKITEKA